MIFVFAGLIILILSFVIALISLVRDSSKVEKTVEEPTPAAQPPPKTQEPFEHNFEQNAQSLANDATRFEASRPPVATPLPPETNVPPQGEEQQEPFLWEDTKEEETLPLSEGLTAGVLYQSAHRALETLSSTSPNPSLSPTGTLRRRGSSSPL